MDDSSATPARSNFRMLLDNSISIPCTPNPQATSTVERHARNGFEFVTESPPQQDLSLSSDKQKRFLSSAIDDLRGMTKRLEALSQSNNSDSENMPPPPSSSSNAPWSRRSSYATDSVGNSSLGILNVDDLEYRLSCSSAAPPPDAAADTFDWKGLSTRSVLSESNLSLSAADASAALKLELQKALAHRAIKRACDKNPFEESKSHSSAAWDLQSVTSDGPPPKPHQSPATSTQLPTQVCSPFVAFSPQDVPLADISKESFVPGELALSRLEKDEDSWREKFGGFPDDRASSVSTRPCNVTQSLDFSMSGVISGDVTLSSSLAANVAKKRISAGEYFGLRSEQLGRLDMDSPEPPPQSERPNFGQEIHSPKNIRRAPLVPLVPQGGQSERSRLSDVSLDKVPTRDTGLYDDDRPSLNTFDFTFGSEAMSPTNSAELMPPPPPPPSESAAPPRRESSSRSSKTRRSLQVTSSGHGDASKRLSMSAAAGNIGDVSYMSEDEPTRRCSNQTVASLTHIAQLLSDMSGRMSTRIVVDNLLEGCTGSSSSSKSRPGSGADDGGQSASAPMWTSRNSTPKGSAAGGQRLHKDANECNLSVKQRVTEWMSKSDADVQNEMVVVSKSPAQSTPRESLASQGVASQGIASDLWSDAEQLSSSPTGGNDSTPVIGPRHGSTTPCSQAERKHTPSALSTSATAPVEMGNVKTPSVCGSVMTMRTLSRHGDTSSLSANSPFHVDSTHTQLSWPSVALGSSKTQYFALRNKSNGRIRLLVSSDNPAFKLLGERGEGLSELTVSMHCEEARRIHVAFSPAVAGPVSSRLVISRVAGPDSEQRKERRLIPLYGFGGQALVTVEGAPKDQWAQLFVNLTYVDGDLSGATFCTRNSGNTPAFVTAEISTEGVPFADCGVTISPTTLILVPGQAARLSLRWDPDVQVLEWLTANAGDVHVVANVWLSWAELSTWQRIARLYQKYYCKDVAGPLAQWGDWYKGDLEAVCQLKDNKTAENSLVQSLRRIKVAVLGEREMLRGFDLDASVVFQQLTVNDTVIMNSPLEDDRSSRIRSPAPALVSVSSPVSSASAVVDSPQLERPLEERQQRSVNLDPTATPVHSDSYVVRFPPTLLNRKTCSKITFKNTSTEQHHGENPLSQKKYSGDRPDIGTLMVAVRGVTEPFSVPTSEFDISGNWYINLRVFFKPQKGGRVRRLIEIWVDGRYKLTYELVAEGIESVS